MRFSRSNCRSGGRSRRLAGAFLAAGTLGAAGLALAAPGELDASFNGTGQRVIQLPAPPAIDPPFSVAVNGMALQKDGKVVLALSFQPPGGAAFAVMRLNADGSTDPTFAGGIAVLPAPYAGQAQGVAVAEDGKIVAVGVVVPGAEPDFGVARFNPDGTLDASFGMDGVATADTGGADAAAAVAIQRDGKIVVAGTTVSGGARDFGLARFKRDGTPDPTFAGDGTVITDFGGQEFARAVSVQPDGRLLAAGTTDAGGVRKFALARYNSRGGLDRSFNTSGRVITDFGGDATLAGAAIQRDGKIVAAGSVSVNPRRDLALSRYTRNGALDPSFGSGGRVISDLGAMEGGGGVAIQKDGRILVAGSRLAGGGEDFLAARYQKSGRLDPTFGTGGWTTTDFGGSDYALGVALLKDGRIVAAGYRDGMSPQRGAVARYLGR